MKYDDVTTNPIWRTAAILKIVFWLYLNAKFCRIKQNRVLTRYIYIIYILCMTKIPNFENSRWRTAAILKLVLSLYPNRKSSDFNEIWYADDTDCASKIGYLTKYQNFATSKWRTAAILKIVFWISRPMIIRLTRNFVG